LGHTAVRSNPKGTSSILSKAQYFRVGQALGMSKASECASVVPKKSVVGTDPKVACMILQQAFDI
jgi:hypothetical protein